jgi:hypothetical protein
MFGTPARFPFRILVWGSAVGLTLGAAIWSALAFDVFVDLVANWLAVPCMIAMFVIGVVEAVAAPFGLYLAMRAGALREWRVWFALALGCAYLVVVAQMAVAAIYAV